jgi:hypothetical protein
MIASTSTMMRSLVNQAPFSWCVASKGRSPRASRPPAL